MEASEKAFSPLSQLRLESKSLYRSRAGSHFYGTEYEIWTEFRPVGNTEKKWGTNYEQLLRAVF